jgi:FKBP12-rapamycin complex-associated protein
MREHSATIVDQAELVSTELIRAAILWHEQWHEALEEASKHYFADHDVDAMFAVLEPLHRKIEEVGYCF